MSELYNTVYLDPPWKTKAGRPLGEYTVVNGKQVWKADSNQTRELAYPTMSIDDIKKLPVSKICSPNAHLYMWTTNGFLPQAFEIISEWGFKYSTTLVWAKTPFGGGLGGAFKISTEFLIFARRGSLKTLKDTKGTWFNVKRSYVNGVPKHSKKPEFFHDLIEKTSPGPYLEMFARDPRIGWDVWGNQAPNSIELPI